MEELDRGERVKYFFSYITQVPLQRPKMINFGLTQRCNLRCKICESWDANPNLNDELTVEEIKDVISQIASWGDIGISFAGGEPMIRKDDLVECIKHAKEKGLTTHVTTNGTLIDKKLADQIVRSGLDCLSISLDGATEKTNDYIRGKGAFKKTIRATKYLLKSKEKNKSDINLIFATVITNKNIKDIFQIIKIAERLGISDVNLNPFNIDTSYQKNKYYDNEFWVSEENLEKLEALRKKLIEYKKVHRIVGTPYATLKLLTEYFEKKDKFRGGICLAGYNYMHVKPNGVVDVCMKGPSINVREMGIKKIWYSSNFLRTRLKIMNCKKHCLMLCFLRI